MKRLHVHASVADLDASVRFYTELFAAPPSLRKPDYAKWMLNDPPVNFAISQRGAPLGIDHLGIQVEDRQELAEVYARLERADGPVLEEGTTTCCYAHSEKSWIADPQGVRWETFLTTGESTVYGTDRVGAVTGSSHNDKPPCCEPTCSTSTAPRAATPGATSGATPAEW